MEDKQQQALWEQLAREVSGNASEADQAQGQENPDPAAEAAFQQAERVWAATARPDAAYEPNVESGWQRLQLRVQTREAAATPIRKRNPYAGWAVAASIALFLAFGAYFVARQLQPSWAQVSTAANETRVVRLADGSTVSLNENSTLSYPDNFQKENRTVRLKGEAFFEVARAEGKRFTIFAAGTKTEVIGTSFNLRAYDREPVKVQVVTGKVAFAKTATEDAIFLVAGQEGMIGADAHQLKPVKQKIENQNFQAWKTKDLVFTNLQLSELVATLESHYHADIVIENEALRHCRFTSSFKDPELKEVLDILAIAGNLTITQDSNRYVISGPGCQ
jgi:ferric-dicitrate binding protein FerR (iron transport regulator)